MGELPIEAILTDSLAAFRPGHLGPDRRVGRAAGFILTAVAHLGLLAVFLFGVRVAVPVIIDAKPLAVSIEKRTPLPVPVLNMIPRMVPPEAIHVIAPEFTIQPEPSPVLASVAPVPTVPAPATPAAPQLGTADLAYLMAIHKFLQKELDELDLARGDMARGTVDVHFIINRSGRLLFFEILKSSGYASLDKDALLLMQKAGSLPPMPASMAGDALNARVPISFTPTSAPSFGVTRFGR